MMINPFELVPELKQTNSVDEYREQFELYVNPLQGTDSEFFIKEIVYAEVPFLFRY